MPEPRRKPFKIVFDPDITSDSARAEHAAAVNGQSGVVKVCAYRAHYGVNLYSRAAEGSNLWYSPLLVLKDDGGQVLTQAADGRYASALPTEDLVPVVHAESGEKMVPKDKGKGVNIPAELINSSIEEVIAHALEATV